LAKFETMGRGSEELSTTPIDSPIPLWGPCIHIFHFLTNKNKYFLFILLLNAWQLSFLTTDQHNIGYVVPYCKNYKKEFKYLQKV